MIRDLVLAAAALVLAAVYWRAADALPRSLLSDEVGAEGLPKLLAIALALAALLLAARAWRRAEPEVGESLATHVRPLGVPLIGAAYVVLAPRLGYAPALALLIAAAVAYFGSRAWVSIALSAVLGAAALWLVFARLLGVSMPAARWLA